MALAATIHEENVLVITLSRPDRLNAMNLEMAQEFHRALDAVADGGAVVITGAGRAFSAGADVKDGSGVGSGGITWFETFDRLAALEVPVIAAIEGWCLGGGMELALCCDLRVGSETARLGTPEVKHGVFPAGGGTQRLSSVIGAGRAKELLLVGDWIDAQTAFSWGLLNRLVPEGEALAAALSLATTVAQHPAQAVAALKRLTRDRDLATGLALERAEIKALLATKRDD
jgi:enoyl-CoA hydratase